jgi:hypothetical protein
MRHDFRRFGERPLHGASVSSRAILVLILTFKKVPNCCVVVMECNVSPLELYPVQVIVFTPLRGPGTKFVDFEGYVHAIDTFRCTNFACSTRDCLYTTDTVISTVQEVVVTPLTQVAALIVCSRRCCTIITVAGD